MRSFLADIFRFFFRFSFFRNRFFGIHRRIIAPANLFRGIKKKTRLRNGIILDLNIGDWVQENLFFLGEYEDAELRFTERSLNPGDIFIDIGANIGLYSLYASNSVGDTGKVIAFEPLKVNFNSLSNNVSINNAGNIVLENVGISDREGEIEIFYDEHEANLGMASSYLSAYSHSEKIATISIDQYIDRNPVDRVDFIKIDIEGGEYQALLGMKNTLIKYSPILLIEINEEVISRTPHNEQDILEYLRNLGYEKHPVDDMQNRKNFAFIKRNQ